MPTISQTPDILRRMAATFEVRNVTYADTTPRATALVAALWPNGVPPEIVRNPAFHLIVQKCIKLARFTNSGLSHEDSILDDGVYSAMICSLLQHGE